MNKYVDASIETIGGGKAKTMFDYELDRAIANCLDPNTDAGKVRKVTLVVSLKPDATRENISCEYHATSKLLSDSAAVEHLLVSRAGKAFVNNTRQMDIDELSVGGDVEVINEETGKVLS